MRTKKSLIRFGDGEALALLGKPLWFQDPAPGTREALFEAFFTYDEHADYLLCVQGPAFLSASEIRDRDETGKLWRNNAKLRGLEAIARHVGARVAPVFDASTYRDGLEDPAPLWAGASHVIIVANRRVFLENEKRERFQGVNLHHIEVPEVDVYPHLERVCAEVRAAVEETKLPLRDVPVIVSAGVVGKIIVLQLMSQYRVLDLGAFVGWPLEREHRPSLHMKKEV
jgi:hypothetical protein